MTSFGRGRGWSSLQSKEQNLRRPGGLSSTNSVVREIIDKIATYDIGENVPSQLIQEIMDLITNPINKENLNNICDTLWKQAILHEQLPTKIGAIFSDNKIALVEDNNKTSIRNRFLCFLQDNYISREKTRLEDSKTFVNMVSLHAETYCCIRVKSGIRLKVLVEPLIQYMQDLLQDNSKQNIYFIMITIIRCGKDLYATSPERLDGLMTSIKQLFIKDDNHDPYNRAMLLLITDLTEDNYELKNKLKEFYLSYIKTLSFDYPCQEELRVIAETKIKENDNEAKDSQEMSKQRIIKEAKNVSTKSDVSERSHHLRNFHGPRAILGSGALDTKKEDSMNMRLSAMRIASPRQNADKSFWNHDDRFHKDYN